MYHCEVCFYMITEQDELFEILKQMPQFLRFSHEYQKSVRAEAELTGRADVILADLRQTDLDSALNGGRVSFSSDSLAEGLQDE